MDRDSGADGSDSAGRHFIIFDLQLNQQKHRLGRQEIRGNTFQRPLEQLLDLLPRYEAAAQQALGGNASGRQEMSELQGRIESAFEALSANYNGKLGEALKFTDAELAARKRDNARLSAVMADWNKLKASSLDAAAVDEVDGRLVNAVRAMISHSGDFVKPDT